MKLICICGTVVHKASLIDLKDTKDFKKRKVLLARCPHCHSLVLSISETRVSDDKTFIKENLFGKQAFNLIFKEKSNILTQAPVIDCSKLKWVYGKNVEVKNRKGEVVSCRQYACDFSGNKTLVKEIKV